MELWKASADAVRAWITAGNQDPARFRAQLEQVPRGSRDVWVDRVFGIEHIAADGAHLPRGCSPYLPCPVDSLVRGLDLAQVRPTDVVIDVGSGVGRAALLVRLLTGASVVGIEVQPALVAQSREHLRQMNVSGVCVIEGEAAKLARYVVTATTFFLYCPFSGSRLNHFLDGIAGIAKTHALRICSVDLELPLRSWFQRLRSPHPDVSVYQSNLRYHTAGARSSAIQRVKPQRLTPRNSESG